MRQHDGRRRVLPHDRDDRYALLEGCTGNAVAQNARLRRCRVLSSEGREPQCLSAVALHGAHDFVSITRWR